MKTRVKPETVLKAQAGDPEAREEVVVEMDQMVHWVLNLVSWRGDFEDGLQEGRIGVLEALKRYDPSFGTQFNTFAFFWIRKSLERAMGRFDLPSQDCVSNQGGEEEDHTLAEINEIRDLVFSLSPEEFEVIFARFYEGKTMEKIGEEMGLHKWTVSLKITSILNGLKAKLS